MAGRGVVVDFNANIARFTSNLDKITNDLSRFQTNADRVGKQVDKSFSFMATSLKGAFAGVTAGLSLREYGQLADTFQNIQARLKLATRDANEFAVANENIKRIATSSQSPLESTATLYTRISQSLLDVGGTQKQVADVTQAMAVALRISGSTAAEASSAMLQFSQAIGSGVLRGEEFNAVNEAAPRLMRALADSLNVPVGKLREMAQEGKLTRDILVDALGSQLPKLIKEAETLPNTIGAAFTKLKNEALLAVGEIDKMTQASSRAADMINSIAKGVSGWKDFITTSDEQQITKRLEFIGKSIDSILMRRNMLGRIGIDSSSFGQADLQKYNAEALQLQKNLQKIRDDATASEKASAQASADAAAQAKKKAEELEKATQAEEKRKDALKQAEAAAKSLANQQQSFIAGLEKEAATLGMTASQIKVYEAGLLKISGAKLEGVKASSERIEAFKQEQAALQEQIAFETRQKEQFYAEQERMSRDAQQALEALNKEGRNLQLSVDPIAKMNAEVERYSELLEAAAIDQKTFDLAVAQSTDNMKRATKDGFEEMSAAAIGFQTNIQRGLGDNIYNALNGNFDSIGQAWKSLLSRMLADAAAANISSALFGKNGSGGLFSMFGSILGSLGGLGKSPAPGALGSSNFGQFLWPVPKFAAGGDFMGGLRLVGENGPELEVTGPSRIYNAKQTKDILSSGGRAAINYAPVINVDSRTDRNEVYAIVNRAVKQGNADLIDRLDRQGRI